LSISYGALAYNAGDHQGCADFYAATCAELGALFPPPLDNTPPNTTDAASSALSDLAAALKRSKTAPDADAKAWALRFGFDQVAVAWNASMGYGRDLVGLGVDNFRRRRYEEAHVAFSSAAKRLNEIRGESLDGIDVTLRLASICSGQALLAQGKAKDAIPFLAAAIIDAPEIGGGKVDLRSIWPAPADYSDAVNALTAIANAAGASADAHAALACEFLIGAQVGDAKAEFARAREVDPANAAAKAAQTALGAAPKAARADDPALP
jgi:hypothetical protein